MSTAMCLPQLLPFLPGGIFSSFARAVSADGTVVVGSGRSDSGNEAFRWTESGGMVGLGDLPGGIFSSSATATSEDGSVIVGGSSSASGNEAFLWTSEDGMRSLHDVLATDLGLDLTGWQLSSATGISADGLIIVGAGTNPDGFLEGWVAVLPPGPFCGDGVIDSGEECDDANSNNGDGCSVTCEVENGSRCTGEPSVCVTGFPSVSQWGLVALALLILTAGTLVNRRCRPEQA